jgi:hypothetical protein
VISSPRLTGVAYSIAPWASQLLQRPRRVFVAGVGGAPVPAFGLVQATLLLQQNPEVELGVVVAGVGGYLPCPLSDLALISPVGGNPDRKRVIGVQVAQ